MEALADLLSDMADQPPVRAHASVAGPTSERLPGKPFMGQRGELLVKVGPMVSGRPRTRSQRT